MASANSWRTFTFASNSAISDGVAVPSPIRRRILAICERSVIFSSASVRLPSTKGRITVKAVSA